MAISPEPRAVTRGFKASSCLHWTFLSLLVQLLTCSASWGTDTELRAWKSLPYNQLFFAGELEGWVSGRAGLARTVDGGRSWQALNDTLPDVVKDPRWGNPVSSIYTSPAISDASFVDGLNAWVIARERYVFHTSNGGRSWTDCTPAPVKTDRLAPDESAPRLAGLQFIDRNHGWLLVRWFSGGEIEDAPNTVMKTRQRQELFRTQDGGAQWELASQRKRWDEQLQSFQFVDQQRGWAIRSGDGSLVKTEDGGATWTVVAKLREIPEELQFQHGSSSFVGAEIALGWDGSGWVLGHAGALAEIQPDGLIRAADSPDVFSQLTRSFAGLWATSSTELWAVARLHDLGLEESQREAGYPPPLCCKSDQLLFRDGLEEDWEVRLEVPRGFAIVPFPQSRTQVWALVVAHLPEKDVKLTRTRDGGRTWAVLSEVPIQEETHPPLSQGVELPGGR